MAEADKSTTTQSIWLSEAKVLLAKGYGGASQFAEKLLRDAGAAGRLPWGYRQKEGDAADDEFWGRFATIDFEENLAVRPSYRVYFIGGGAPMTHTGGPEHTEWFGVWVSRAHVLALLPPSEHEKVDGFSASARWIAAEAKRMKAAGEISPDIKITHLAKLLEDRMEKAAAGDRSLRAAKWGYIKNNLPKWGLWPVSSIQ